MDWTDCIIAVAPNGARKTKDDHPALPMTPAEIAREAAQCVEAGASMLHLHVRDAEGKHSLDPDAYRAATDAVRAELGNRVVIQITTEAVGMYSAGEQIAIVKDVVPEAVSVALREISPDAAHEPMAAGFFEWLRSENVLTQYILYTPEEVTQFNDMQRRGIIPEDAPSVLYVLGRYTEGQKSTPADLLPFLEARGGLLANNRWFLCAFGERENACATTAAALGGHARLGFENNMQLSDGGIAPSNAALIDQFRKSVTLLGRNPADADGARRLLGAGG